MSFAPLLFVALLAPGPDDDPVRFDPKLLVGVWELIKSTENFAAGSTVVLLVLPTRAGPIPAGDARKFLESFSSSGAG